MTAFSSGVRIDYYAAIRAVLDAHRVDDPALAADLVDVVSTAVAGSLRAAADSLDEYGDRFYAAVLRQVVAQLDPQ